MPRTLLTKKEQSILKKLRAMKKNPVTTNTAAKKTAAKKTAAKKIAAKKIAKKTFVMNPLPKLKAKRQREALTAAMQNMSINPNNKNLCSRLKTVVVLH